MALNDLGFIPLGTVIPLMFTSHDLATGANEAASGFAITDVEIYKGTSMTQRASDAGYVLIDTDGIDLDGHVGVNGVSIDTGDNTDAGFFVAGSFYNVIVGPITIDAQTVNVHLASFYLIAAPNVAGVLEVDVTHWIGTAAATPTVAGVPEVDLTHVAGSTTSVSTMASTLATLLADIGGVATAAADGDPTSTDLLFAYIKQLINVLTGSAGIVAWPASAAPANGVSLAEGLRSLYDQVGTAGAGLTAADDATIAAIAAVSTKVDAVDDLLDTELPALTTAVADLPTNAELATALGTADDAVLAILGTPAGASMSADIAAIEAQTDDIGAAGAGLTALATQASVDTIDNFLDTEMAAVLAAVDTEVAAIKAVTDLLIAAQAEPTGVPAANATPLAKLGFVFAAVRNKNTITSTKKTFFDDADAAMWEKDLTDDGTTYTETKGNAI